MSEITKKLETIAEVERALVITRDGVAVEDTSYEAEFLGAHSLFLGQFANKLSAHFGVGELKSATVHGMEHHMLLFESKNHYLGVTAKGSGNVNAIDAEVRRVLSQK